jgi:hypothetical protein
MPKFTPPPDPLPRSVRALVVGPVVASPAKVPELEQAESRGSCPICLTPLRGRQRACSGRGYALGHNSRCRR